MASAGYEEGVYPQCYKGESRNSQSDSSVSYAVLEAMERINARLSQVVQALDDQRASFSQFLMTIGIVFCVGLAALIGYHIYNIRASRLEPPQLQSYVPIPVKIGNKTVLLGVGVVQWDVPPELDSIYLKIEQMKQEAKEKAAAEEAIKEQKEKKVKDDSNAEKETKKREKQLE